ncbi:MAG: UDP-2,3-diacylglucosamine diphosphatase [Lentisphaerae bacterium]|nr:UDP-2,3-diacylglucosamine diphosphatase [Lentisphaerota bacterium]
MIRMPDASEFAVISDVHLGSRYFLRDRFGPFVEQLPAGVTLVLNGDTIDRPKRRLSAEDKVVLDMLISQSLVRRIVWVYGNHDKDCRLERTGNIEFVHHFEIGKRLFIAHGHDFDNIMPRNRIFIILFRAMHHSRILFGAQSMHVAFYAKKWAFLYKILRDHVRRNAVEYATENGFSCVACGHTHYVEDITEGGIRYINTGSWTEDSPHWIHVTHKSVNLRAVKQMAL